MKSFPVLLVLLASTLSSTALSTPYVRIRRQDSSSSSDTSNICSNSNTNPALVAVTNVTVSGNQTLQLARFSCADTASPFSAAHSEEGILDWLGGLLWCFFPPYKPPPKPKPTTTVKTVTKATTATDTETVTSVSVSVSVSATTDTDTETATVVTTATATEVTTATETSATTIVESTTDTATATVTVTASPTPTGTNVCGEICTTVCGEAGQLPPETEDCQALVNSITILTGQIDPDFTVDPQHVQTISFGTCRFFFENTSPSETLTYCWLSLVQVASAAASQCLPPSQPVLSEGLCLSQDGLWEVGVAHS